MGVNLNECVVVRGESSMESAARAAFRAWCANGHREARAVELAYFRAYKSNEDLSFTYAFKIMP